MFAGVPEKHKRCGMEYVLKNECLTVSFLSFGGALHSIQDEDGLEYLWQGNAEYWSGQAPVQNMDKI